MHYALLISCDWRRCSYHIILHFWFDLSAADSLEWHPHVPEFLVICTVFHRQLFTTTMIELRLVHQIHLFPGRGPSACLMGGGTTVIKTASCVLIQHVQKVCHIFHPASYCAFHNFKRCSRRLYPCSARRCSKYALRGTTLLPAAHLFVQCKMLFQGCNQFPDSERDETLSIYVTIFSFDKPCIRPDYACLIRTYLPSCFHGRPKPSAVIQLAGRVLASRSGVSRLSKLLLAHEASNLKPRSLIK